MPIATLDQVAARGSQTALMLAAYSGQFRVATALLEAGADVDARHEGSFGQDKTARQSHSMNLKSKWRNISNPDAFCSSTTGAGAPTKTRLKSRFCNKEG